MLVLTRKFNDAFVIELEGVEELIEVKVTEIANGKVRLGITAPEGCKIWRKELYQTMRLNQQAAKEQSAINVRGALSKLQNQISEE